MCTVLLRFTPGGPGPVLLGAVRDEFVDRAWDPPAAHWGDRLLGGRDRSAGGTWLAVDPDRPAVAAVLNGVPRSAPSTVDGRPSRGGLPLAALRGEPLPQSPILDRYDGFHLVLATLSELQVWSWDGTTVLVDGTHNGRRYGSTSTSLVELAPVFLRYQFNARPRDPSGWFDVPTVIKPNPLP